MITQAARQNKDAIEIDHEAFAALGSRPRARLLMALVDEPQRPSELTEHLDKPLALWYHIGPLLATGLVVAQHVEPKRVLYHINVDRLRALALELDALADMAPPLPSNIGERLAMEDALEQSEMEAPQLLTQLPMALR